MPGRTCTRARSPKRASTASASSRRRARRCRPTRPCFQPRSWRTSSRQCKGCKPGSAARSTAPSSRPPRRSAGRPTTSRRGAWTRASAARSRARESAACDAAAGRAGADAGSRPACLPVGLRHRPYDLAAEPRRHGGNARAAGHHLFGLGRPHHHPLPHAGRPAGRHLRRGRQVAALRRPARADRRAHRDAHRAEGGGRGAQGREEGLMPRIKVLPHAALCPRGAQIEARRGVSICDTLLENHIEIEHACEKQAACTTCHVILREGFDSLQPAEEKEEDMLDKAWGLEATSRLSCQAKVEDRDLTIELPKYTINYEREGGAKK